MVQKDTPNLRSELLLRRALKMCAPPLDERDTEAMAASLIVTFNYFLIRIRGASAAVSAAAEALQTWVAALRLGQRAEACHTQPRTALVHHRAQPALDTVHRASQVHLPNHPCGLALQPALVSLRIGPFLSFPGTRTEYRVQISNSTAAGRNSSCQSSSCIAAEVTVAGKRRRRF